MSGACGWRARGADSAGGTRRPAYTCSLCRLRGKTELLDCGRKYVWRWARVGREGAAHLTLPFPPLARTPAHLPAHSLPSHPRSWPNIHPHHRSFLDRTPFPNSHLLCVPAWSFICRIPIFIYFYDAVQTLLSKDSISTSSPSVYSLIPIIIIATFTHSLTKAKLFLHLP